MLHAITLFAIASAVALDIYLAYVSYEEEFQYLAFILAILVPVIVFAIDVDLYVAVKENQEKDKNQIKTGQKRKAWQSREKFKAAAVERGRKDEENKKRMAENAYTYQKLCKFKDKRKDKGLKCYFKKVQPQGPKMQTLQSCGARDDTCK
nr:hypothetical protein [Tanacetum cinerariifolium]